MLSSLCHIWWICGCVESFALVCKWGGPGVRRKGLPQASAAVWWAVTGSLSQPTGTETTLWSVSISDLYLERKKSILLFIRLIYPTQCLWNLISESLYPRLVCSLFLCLADLQLIFVALQCDSGMIFNGRSMLIFFSIVPISFSVTELLELI